MAHPLRPYAAALEGRHALGFRWFRWRSPLADRQSVWVPSPPKPFIVALVTYMVSSAIALALPVPNDPSDKGSVAGAAAVALAIFAILWFFAARGHRWPKWCLLVLLVIAIGAHVAFLDLRSILASLDVVALAVLLRGWSSIERQEQGRLGTA